MIACYSTCECGGELFGKLSGACISISRQRPNRSQSSSRILRKFAKAMNWTGGNLSRVSKGSNKSTVQRQKEHFAKVRTKLRDCTTMGDESITEALAHLSSGQKTTPQLSNGKRSHHGNPTTVTTPSGSFRSRSARYPNASHASTAESGGTGKLVTSPPFEHCQDNDSKQQHLGTSIDAERRRLLEGQDWLGLELMKPLEAKFSKVRKEQVGKRKKLYTDPRLQSRSLMHRPLQSCTLPVEAESVHNKRPDREVILVRIGSHALSTDGSSFIKPNSCRPEHPRVKVDTSTKCPYGLRSARYDSEMSPEARTAQRQLGYIGDSCRRSVSISNPHYRGSEDARTTSPFFEVDPEGLLGSIGLSKTQSKSYNVLLHRDVTNGLRDADFTDMIKALDFDNACVPNSASVSSLPNNELTVPSQNRFSSAVTDAGEESRAVQQIQSDEAVVGGEEDWKQLMEMGVKCKKVRRSSPAGRAERHAWDCTLQDGRERAQSSNHSATTQPSHFIWSDFHTGLGTSFRSSPITMNGVEAISKPEDSSGQVRRQLQDQSTDLWERFIFGSNALISPTNYFEMS